MDYIEIVQVCVQGQPLKQGGAEREKNQNRHQPVGRAIRPEIATQEEKYDRYEKIVHNFWIKLGANKHHDEEISRHAARECHTR